MTNEIKEAVKAEMTNNGIFFIFPKENQLGYRVYLMVLDSIETVRALGKEYYEKNTTAGETLKNIIYKFC